MLTGCRELGPFCDFFLLSSKQNHEEVDTSFSDEEAGVQGALEAGTV